MSHTGSSVIFLRPDSVSKEARSLSVLIKEIQAELSITVAETGAQRRHAVYHLLSKSGETEAVNE